MQDRVPGLVADLQAHLDWRHTVFDVDVQAGRRRVLPNWSRPTRIAAQLCYAFGP